LTSGPARYSSAAINANLSLLDLPVGVVEESVVSAAERDAVVEAGWTMIVPVDDVVDVAPAGRY
jgi:hypothetical protein